MAQGHDNPNVTSTGLGGEQLSYQVLNRLKNLGVAPKTAQVRTGETVEDVLMRLDLHPRVFKVGENDPAIMAIVNEVISNLTASQQPWQPGHTPAPIINSKPEGVGSPSDHTPSYSQSYEQPVPGEYRMMTQGDNEDLLIQTWYSSPLQLVQDASSKLPDHTLARFTMPITVADIVSHKNEVYPQKVWEENLQSLRQMAQDNRLLGTNDHPNSPNTPLSGVSLLFDDVKWAPMRRQDGGLELIGSGYILDTQMGRDLYNLLQVNIPGRRKGVPVDVSSRGVGRTAPGEWKDKRGVQVVQNFVCRAFDAVLGGASPGASFENAMMNQSNDDPEPREPIRLRRTPRLRLGC